MRVAIHTYGTRGDVQPFVAFALALRSAGHDVQLAGPVQYASLAKDREIAYVALPGDLVALIDTPEGKAAIEGGEGFAAGLRLLKNIRPLIEGLLLAEWEAARDFRPDAIVYHPKSLAALHIAERLGSIPILAAPLPVLTPTSAFPSPILPFRSLGPLNRLSHRAVAWGSQRLFARTVSKWRHQHLSLPPDSPQTLRPKATLYSNSRHIIPIPADWDKDVHVTGPWFLERPDWAMPSTLQDFIAGGSAPVYVGFGSMPAMSSETLTEAIVGALRLTGRRGLLLSGGGAISPSLQDPDLYVLQDAPHDRILPFAHSALHHGGAGTTMASAKAGIPCAICPFFGDQPFWARRMYDLGVSPPPLSRKRITTEAIAGAIDAMDAPSLRDRAASLGEQVRQEEGLKSAVALLERYCL